MLNYLSNTVPVGNGVFGLTNTVPVTLWGLTFVDDRFALVLVVSGSSVYWSRVDTYTDTVTSYDMPFTPAQAGIASTDTHESTAGSYLASDDTYLYYLKGATVFRINRTDGSSAGSQIVRTTSNAVIPSNALGTLTVKGSMLYCVSKSQQLAYAYSLSAWTWDGSSKSAVRQVSVPELSSYSLCGAFCQPGTDNDFVILLKLGSTSAIAIKYTSDLLTRKGQTTWNTPSTNIHAACFKSSILYVAQNDPTVAGGGVLMHMFGDGSTDIVAKENTSLTISKDRVKAGSGDIVTITYIARDGYGLTFPPSEVVRFSLVKIGEAFDKNDGALSPSSSGPFRDSSSNPLYVALDIPFDNTGKAVCYWQTPIEVPIDVLLHRIKVKYPIQS